MRSHPMPRTGRAQAILDRIAAVPDGTWARCSCQAVLHAEQVAAADGVCPECGGYFRLDARRRIAQLVDRESFEERHGDLVSGDPLRFVDRLPYARRLALAQESTGLAEGVVVGSARIASRPVSIAVMDFRFLGGSMGSVIGEKIALAAEYAGARHLPLVAVCASGGARMQEGVLSLVQMAKTAAAIRRMRERGGFLVCVLTDPVYGGVSASFAALGDVILAERRARAGFAGPRVIQQTIRRPLPTGFQTAEFLLAHGHVDAVVPREDLASTIRQVVRFAADRTGPPLPAAGLTPMDTPGADPDAWDLVARARAPGRPTTPDYLRIGFTDVLELHGDRMSDDDPAVVGALARLHGTAVMVVGHAKGSDTRENVRRNFGMPHPAGYRKAVRLFRLAEHLGIPLVTLVDTPGAYPGTGAEEQNQSGAIAEALAVMTGLRVPVVSVITGEGGSGGALALAAGDRLLMQENTTLSVISPEGCATILFGDAGRAPEAARSLGLRAVDLLEQGIADEIVPEPPGGAQSDPVAAVEGVLTAVRRHLTELAGLPAAELTGRRHHRLRSWGQPARLAETVGAPGFRHV